MSVFYWSLNRERDAAIYEDVNAGMTQKAVAAKFNISAPRVAQICDRANRHINARAYNAEDKDKYVAALGTWAQKVDLLLPHISEIESIAKEK